MTTDELIERLNKNIYIDAELDDGEIEVADGSGDSFFVIPINATNFLEIIFVESPADVLNKVASEYVAAQIEEYLQTPIEERNPKKKYVLAWCGDDNGKSNYFVKHNGSWFLVPQKGDEFPEEALFTQKELDQIGERCFYMKPVIEALKVEV